MIVVTLCGSSRFRELINATAQSLATAGFVALQPTLLDMSFAERLDPSQRLLAWRGGTLSHFERIRRAHVCLICNPGGYSGVSTTLELGYAVAVGKLIVAMSQDDEGSRQGLVDFVLDTDEPVAVAKRLESLLGVATRSGAVESLPMFP